MPKRSIKLVIWITLLAALIIAFILFWFGNKKPQTTTPAVTININKQPTIGDPQANIQIVAFEDLKCANCKIYNTTLFPIIKKKYIDSGIAKYSIITLAFIPGSKPAGNAALCLYDQKSQYFFNFIEHVYANQPAEDQDWATIAKLLQFAKESAPQANLNELSQCMVTGGNLEQLQNNIELAAKVMQNQVATPALYVNGKPVQPLTMKRLQTLIKAAH